MESASIDGALHPPQASAASARPSASSSPEANRRLSGENSFSESRKTKPFQPDGSKVLSTSRSSASHLMPAAGLPNEWRADILTDVSPLPVTEDGEGEASTNILGTAKSST